MPAVFCFGLRYSVRKEEAPSVGYLGLLEVTMPGSVGEHLPGAIRLAAHRLPNSEKGRAGRPFLLPALKWGMPNVPFVLI
jgi:hypothetical protein